MKKIIWIASYPKSGNTWLRAILTSLFYSKDGIFNFSLLNYINHFDNFERYKFIKLININDYDKINKIEIISKYRTLAQKNFKTDKDFYFFKTHSANIALNNFKYTNEENTLGLIYIIRDPRDIVISYAKFMNISIDKSIKKITNTKNVAKTMLRDNKKLPFILSSWDLNYQSWELLKVPKLFIFYEDLLKDPTLVLYKIIDFFNIKIGLNTKDFDIKFDNIIKSTSFPMMQKNENKFGFNEATKHSRFFRKGIVNQWKTELEAQQVLKIENQFKPTMQKLNYL